MAVLITIQGPENGQTFPLDDNQSTLGRELGSTVHLPAKAVSRRHALITSHEGAFFVEDLDSSNGTFLNGKRINVRVPTPLTERDTLQIGPYLLGLRAGPLPSGTEPDMIIREQVSVADLSQSVYGQDPAQKLQVVLEIAQNLGRTLQLEPLLEKLLDQLMRLFPAADRCMVLLLEDDRLVVRGQRGRHQQDASTFPYSRTILQQALDQGIGILSDDVKEDERFLSVHTLTSINVRSLLCVPLITQDQRRLGVIQLDRFRPGFPFRTEDLYLLTTVGLQVAVVLENAAMHADLLRQERLHQELALARDIQQGFLPSDFDDVADTGVELFARVDPARQVSGDLYDFFRLGDGRLAFFVGDVSGKGMPAALFMIAVRTLCRHLAATGDSPAQTLRRLNEALADDNPSGMFVTLAHGIYDPPTGEVTLSSAGHPLPLLRTAEGDVKELDHPTGRLLGYRGGELHLTERLFSLGPGDLLVLYTDGVTEARSPDRKAMFGADGLKALVRGFESKLSLAVCLQMAREGVEAYAQSRELHDDLTLFLLRRALAPTVADNVTPRFPVRAEGQ
jgi:serine phosphatase RsbU (regulator of sigma subunit)